MLHRTNQNWGRATTAAGNNSTSGDNSSIGSSATTSDSLAATSAAQEVPPTQPVDPSVSSSVHPTLSRSVESIATTSSPINVASPTEAVAVAPGKVATDLRSADAGAQPAANPAQAGLMTAAGKTSSTRGIRSLDGASEKVAARTTHDADTAVHEAQPGATNPVGQNVTTVSSIRDGSSYNPLGAAQTSGAHSASGVTSGTTTGDTFAALDSEAASPAATWTHASSQRAEAGYLDPSLGWVGVRADTAGGIVHAAVVPGSAEAAQALGGQLSSLNAHLAQTHAQAANVTLASPESAGNGQGNTQGQGTTQGNPQGQSRGDGPASGAQTDFSFGTSRRGNTQAINSGDSARFASVPQTANSGGYISVMA